MRKLNVATLMIVFMMLFAVVRGYGEEIKACISKKLFLPPNFFDTMKYSDIKRLQEMGQLRIANDLSECSQNERFRTFDMSINNEMLSEETNDKMLFSKQHILTINKNGTGKGTVILSPSGVGSDSAPVQKYRKGTLVVLTASPDENSVFTGWKGDGCLGNGVCVLTMSSDKTVTAIFHETNASGTVVMRNKEKSKVPDMNKETEQHETKKNEKQTMEKLSQPQKPSETLYAVQAGAFRNASYAKSLKMMLAQKGYHAYIITSKSRIGGEFNKVLIGRFSDRREAENLSKKILKMENLPTFVTSYKTR